MAPTTAAVAIPENRKLPKRESDLFKSILVSEWVGLAFLCVGWVVWVSRVGLPSSSPRLRA